MTHLQLFNKQSACGSSDGERSSFIDLVDCERCREWHKINNLATSLLPVAMYGLDEGDPFGDAEEDMKARLYAEFQERQNG
jgi:hypothetical protein